MTVGKSTLNAALVRLASGMRLQAEGRAEPQAPGGPSNRGVRVMDYLRQMENTKPPLFPFPEYRTPDPYIDSKPVSPETKAMYERIREATMELIRKGADPRTNLTIGSHGAGDLPWLTIDSLTPISVDTETGIDPFGKNAVVLQILKKRQPSDENPPIFVSFDELRDGGLAKALGDWVGDVQLQYPASGGKAAKKAPKKNKPAYLKFGNAYKKDRS